MKCPYCQSTEIKVVDKRATTDLDSIRRRRECEKCEKRFTTFERIELIDLMILKKDGRSERFDRNKLTESILSSIGKRPFPTEKVVKFVDEIENKLKSRENIEVKSSEIGEMVMTRLKKIDKIAYIRFASLCKPFDSFEALEKEVRNLKGD